jgi:hypothetical protein
MAKISSGGEISAKWRQRGGISGVSGGVAMAAWHQQSAAWQQT